jgi:hypothetical protein
MGSGDRFCVRELGRNLDCHLEDVLIFNILKRKCYRCCTSSAIFKDNAEINYITIQDKNVHFRQLRQVILR